MSTVLTKDIVSDIDIDSERSLYNSENESPRFNAETLAAFEETKAIMRGEIPAKRYKPHEFEEVWKGLLED